MLSHGSSGRRRRRRRGSRGRSSGSSKRSGDAANAWRPRKRRGASRVGGHCPLPLHAPYRNIGDVETNASLERYCQERRVREPAPAPTLRPYRRARLGRARGARREPLLGARGHCCYRCHERASCASRADGAESPRELVGWGKCPRITQGTMDCWRIPGRV